MPQTGEMDQRVTFWRPTVTGQDSMGADIAGDPIEIRTVWAKVQYLTGRELEAALQRWAESKYKITFRRQPGIDLRRTDYADWWNNGTLDIGDINGPGTREDFWTILAKDHEETESDSGTPTPTGLTWDEATQTWDQTTQTWDAI